MWNAITPKKLAVATCNFDGRIKHGLLVNVGDTVQIYEECLGWYRGCNLKNKSVLGIFPASYVAFKKCRQNNDGSIVLMEDVTVSEVGYILREWNAIRNKMFTEVYNKRNAKFAIVGEVMLELINSRQLLISESLTSEQTKELKSKISKNIDWGNKLLGLDIIPRMNDEPVDGFRMNPINLYHLHLKSTSASKDITTISKTPTKMKLPQRHQSMSGSVSQLRNPQGSWSSFHILLSLSSSVSTLEHDVIACIRLFDAFDFKPFTGNFLVHINRSGIVSRPDGQSNCSVMFKDLNRDDKERDAYLVVHAYRVGAIKESDSLKSLSSSYKRPIGCGAVRITDALSERVSSEESFSFNCKIISCWEQDFAFFHEHLMRSDMDGTHSEKLTGKSFCMTMSLRLFFGEADELLSKDAHIFKGIALSDKLGFPDIIKPNTSRNDLYVTLISCDIERSNKTSQRNVEARIVVVDKNGKELQDCICLGSAAPQSSEYKSPVIYHCNAPRWNETIMLSLPVESFFECHLRVEFRHCSQKQRPEKKFLGFAFLKLSTSDVTTLHDKVHELYMYKCEESKLLTAAYLKMPDTISQLKLQDASFQVAEKELVIVETMLCSTKLTQNLDIVRLLQWKMRSEEVEDILMGFMKVKGYEIVKFLPDILDTLFDLIGNVRPEDRMLAFKSLVQTFNILEDSKFESFKSVFEMYLTNNFSGILTFRSLVLCMCKVVEAVMSPEANLSSSSTLTHQMDYLTLATNSFKVFDYLFKCIVQSYLLFAKATGGSREEFLKDLATLVQSLCSLLSLQSDGILTIQISCLLNFSHFIFNLSKIFGPEDLGSILNVLIDSIPESGSHQLKKYKLKCLNMFSSSALFQKPEWQRKVMPMYALQLKQHYCKKENIKVSTRILTDILLIFYENKQAGQLNRKEMELLLNSLLMPLMGILHGPLPVDSGNIVACFVSLITFFDEQSYDSFVTSLQSYYGIKEMLFNILKTLDILMESDTFPRDWFAMKMNMNRAILKMLEFVAKSLQEKFLDSGHFDADLWSRYFLVLVGFITQPTLQLGNFSPAKSHRVYKTYGDMRETTADQLSFMWNTLGENKIHFVPGLIGSFLRVSLIDNLKLRKTILPIFFAMMESHQQHFGNFQKVEDELINKLDTFLNENMGDARYQQLFQTIMMDNLNEVTEDWKVNGQSFIQSVGQLLERLLDYRSMLQNEENEEMKMICTVNLLNFYKNETNRREMYIRYISKLSDLHLSSSNHVEAAFSLLLHAKLYRWTDGPLQAGQKEKLYLRIIEEFDKGKCWEYGLPLCEELAVVYKEVVKYDKLSRILQTQSEFYQKILHSHRLQPSYFRVGFYGKEFPPFLRNKEFIYRGHECEKLSSFQNRMVSMFPGTMNLSVNAVPNEISFDSGMYLQINSVRSVPQIPGQFISSDVSESVRSFHRANNISIFILDRPYHKGEVDPNNEFMTLHIERFTLKTKEGLPGILRWSQVESMERIHLCPIEVAIDSMQKMNGELQSLIVEYSTGEEISLSPLTMRLQGVIDAAVQGGVKKYQQVFLSEDFLTKNPGYSELISLLLDLLEEQVKILEEALAIHGRLAPPEVQPLHRRLQDLFYNMKLESGVASSSQSERSSSSSLSGTSSIPANRNSGSFNDTEHAVTEPSLFKQKSHPTSRWYTDESVCFTPTHSSPFKSDMTSRASAFLNFKSGKKNSSTPTLLRTDSVKRITIREESIFYERPASDSVEKSFEERVTSNSNTTTDSDSRSERSCSNSSLPLGSVRIPPVPPPKRFSTHLSGGHQRPPAHLPKPPPPLPTENIARRVNQE